MKLSHVVLLTFVIILFILIGMAALYSPAHPPSKSPVDRTADSDTPPIQPPVASKPTAAGPPVVVRAPMMPRTVVARLKPINQNSIGSEPLSIRDGGRVLRGHAGCVYGLALSPDGKTLASTATDRTVRLWDWQAGKMLQRLQGLTHPAMCIAYASDGKFLAVGQRGGPIIVWDVATGDQIAELRGTGDGVHHVAFIKENKQLLSAGCDGAIRLWDLTKERQIAANQLHGSCVTGFSMAADSSMLLTGSLDGTAALVKLPSLQTAKTMPRIGAGIWAASLINGGRGAVLYPENGRSAFLYELPSGQLTAERKDLPCGLIATTTADGFVAATARGAHASVWFPNSKDSKLVMDLWGARTMLRSIAISADGRYVFAAGGIDPDNPDTAGQQISDPDSAIHIWDLQAGLLAQGKTPLRAIALSSDARLLAKGGDDGIVEVLDAATARVMAASPPSAGPVRQVAFDAANAELLVCSDDQVLRFCRVADLSTATSVRTAAPIKVARLLPNHRVVAAVDKSVLNWDGKATQLTTLLTLDAQLQALAATSDGRLIAAAVGRSVVLADGVTGKELRRLNRPEPGDVSALAFTADGTQILAADANYGIVTFDVASGDPVRQWPAQQKFPRDFQVSKSGRLMLALGTNPAQVYSVQACRLVDSFSGHLDIVTAAALTPREDALFTASLDGSIRRYPLHPGPVFPDLTYDSAESLTVAPNGRIGLCIGWNSAIYDLQTGERKAVLTGLETGNGRPRRWLYARPCFSADSSTIYLGAEYEVVAFDAATGKIRERIKTPRWAAFSIAVSPDRNLLVTCGPESIDQTKQNSSAIPFLVRVFEAKGGRMLREFPAHKCQLIVWPILAISPDSKRLATCIGFPFGVNSDDGTGIDANAIVWDLDTGTRLRQVTLPVGRWAATAFSPDSSHILLVSALGEAFWADIATSRAPEKFRLTWRDVRDAALSGDGKRVLSVDGAGGIYLHEVPGGREIARNGESGNLKVRAYFNGDRLGYWGVVRDVCRSFELPAPSNKQLE